MIFLMCILGFHVPVYLDAFWFHNVIPKSSSKIFLDVFHGFDRVVSRGIAIPSYNVLCLVSLFYGAYNTIVDIVATGGIVDRALSLDLCVPAFVIWIACQLRAVGRWVSLHCRLVYKAIVGNSKLDVLFSNDDGMRLNADDAKLSFAARQELLYPAVASCCAP